MNKIATLEMYPGITIHSNGRVFRDSDGKELGTSNNGGYITLTLTRKDGHRCAIGRNRLVAMAFCECPGDFNDFVVNHKDLNCKNDHYLNLEWVTQRKNIEHSAALNPNYQKFKAIQVRNFDTKEIRRFACMIDAAREYGLHKDLVQLRVKTEGMTLYEDRLQYRLDQGNAPWCEEPKGTYVFVKDVETNDVRLFYRSYDAAKFLQVSQATVSNAINRGNQPLIRGKFLIKYEHDKRPWRVVDDVIKERMMRRRSRAIRVTDPVSGTEMLFEAAIDCAKTMGLTPTALNMRLRSGRPDKVYSDGYQYEYASPVM